MVMQSRFALGFVRANDHNSRDAAHALFYYDYYVAFYIDICIIWVCMYSFLFRVFLLIFFTNQINCNRSYMHVYFIPCYGP